MTITLMLVRCDYVTLFSHFPTKCVLPRKFITWTAADHRNVTLLSYFCDSLKPSQSLLSLTPYTVPWTAVAVYVCDAAGLRPSKTLLVLNGGIVGLCVATLPEVKVTGDLKPRLLKTLPVCQCLGLGKMSVAILDMVHILKFDLTVCLRPYNFKFLFYRLLSPRYLKVVGKHDKH